MNPTPTPLITPELAQQSFFDGIGAAANMYLHVFEQNPWIPVVLGALIVLGVASRVRRPRRR